MSADFIVAYAGSSVAQAALVAGAAAGHTPVLPRPLRRLRLRHGVFALLPLLALVGVVVALRLWPDGADALAKIALVAVPVLALLTAVRIGPVAFGVAVAMVVVVLGDGTSLAGQLSALGLIAGSCMLLGVLLVAVTPAHWLGVGILAMALVDLVLVVSGVLGPASDALNAAVAREGLPQLQRVELGPLTMGYGDVFLPALVGALLAARARPRIWVAGLTLGFALAAGGVFLLVDRLPATVPVALALLVVEGTGAVVRRRRAAAERSGDAGIVVPWPTEAGSPRST